MRRRQREGGGRVEKGGFWGWLVGKGETSKAS